jgi:putative ATP-dependent endonuclease of OLD family
MENYIHFEAINEAYAQFNINLGLTANFADFDDVPKKVAEMVHTLSSPNPWAALYKDAQEEKASKAKKHLNNIAASLMTKVRLAQVDPDGHVIDWFNQMKQLTEV